MTHSIRFEPSAVPPDTFHVASLRGEEAVSRPYRFELDLVSSDPDLPLQELLGKAAVLWLGERRIEGIVAEIEQGDRTPDGFLYRALLAPRLFLASLDVRSRMFRGLSVPDMAQAALAEVKVEVELRLSRPYAAESHAVQYRESTLDFVSRLLAAAGIAYHFEASEAGERVVLTDDNGGFHQRRAASLEDGVSGAVTLRSLRSRLRVAPRAVLLHNDSLDPEAPLEARATVDEGGVGLRVEHAGDLVTPERVAAAAAVAASALRAESTRYAGVTESGVHAGQVLGVSGHFRRDMNRAYLVVEARHTFDGDEPQTTFEAISADMPYRTRPLPKPRVEGFVEARVDAPENSGATSASDGYRVRLPFDLGAPGEGDGSPTAAQMAPGGGLHFPMKGGTPVMVGFVEGDPDRPVIAGAAPSAAGGRRGRSGRVVFETSAAGGAPARSRRARMDGALLEERPFTNEPLEDPPSEEEDPQPEENVTPGTDVFGSESQGGTEFVRFAVPQGEGKFSYLRYGDIPSTGVSATEGEGEEEQTFKFSETVLDGDFRSKHISGRGNTIKDPAEKGKGFTFKLDDVLNDGKTFDMSRKGNSPANNAVFKHAQSQGVFDYTDDNRTVITQGDHQTITAGNRTDVILGDYRVVIPKRTQGIYDADDYYLRFFPQGDGFRKTEVSHVRSNSVLYGDSETLMTGFQADLTLGTDIDTFVGVGVEANFGLNLDLGFSFRGDLNFGHTYSKHFGKNISSASQQNIEASKSISIQIPSTSGWDTKMKIAAYTLGAASVTTLAAGLTEFGADNNVARYTLASGAMLAFAIAMGFAHRAKKDEPKDEDASIFLDKDQIKLSVGTASLTLMKGANANGDQDRIVLEVGNADSCITLTKTTMTLESADSMGITSSQTWVTLGNFLGVETVQITGATETTLEGAVDIDGDLTINGGQQVV